LSKAILKDSPYPDEAFSDVKGATNTILAYSTLFAILALMREFRI